ncbi:hypothetical protein EYF80_009909 [Liparis tanakae]|uniref:Uncharacterized protein n=1 Tax=Liparis tanakae TaxID=230148 RepID=A0A4Z2IRK3_9TELE|nr:hypothetical protein EYF80_009909 [Liparis tanakae]
MGTGRGRGNGGPEHNGPQRRLDRKTACNRATEAMCLTEASRPRRPSIVFTRELRGRPCGLLRSELANGLKPKCS